MAYLSKAKPIADLGRRRLVVLWGKSNTGKTMFGSTFPKPMLYVQIGDDGSNTISDIEGVKAIRAETDADVKGILTELLQEKGAGYQTIFFDTFSMITNVWTDDNVIQKGKRMTQQAWGDLKTETEELIRKAHKLALHAWVILSCHEVMDSIDGMEDEILPDARPNVSKGARTYLEGMANYGFHTTRVKKDVIENGAEKTIVRYAVHIGANPYYWTKLQIPKGAKIPALMINPTFEKLQEKGII